MSNLFGISGKNKGGGGDFLLQYSYFQFSSPINCLITIDNWLIASADDNGGVKIWDYRRKDACMESTSDCSDYISDLAVSKDRKILLATW
jgi:WD40 repeat protein